MPDERDAAAAKNPPLRPTAPRPAPAAHAATLPMVGATATALDLTLADSAEVASTLAATAAPAAVTAHGSVVGAASFASTSSYVRSTVLPRVRVTGGVREPAPPLPRYEKVRLLGAGGVGEVALAHDHDIDRVVAVKRLLPEQNNLPTLLRFAEEVRTIGRLEHPNIVPIHDVGIDEDGQHYFVMKYVEGETLETIVEKLHAGDAAYARRFSHEARAQIFLAVLQAVQYAHARGIVHRDIKPANIMVGPYGEVMVMDWGLAKKIRDPATGRRLTEVPAAPSAPGALGAGDEGAPVSHERTVVDASSAEAPGETEHDRLFKTRHGTLLGTPAYMSPEQALGHNDQLDERSDVYSLGVLLHELFTLEHYLADQTTVGSMLVAISSENRGGDLKIVMGAPAGVPVEYLHIARKAMQRDPAERYQSVAEMAAAVKSAIDGTFQVQCPVTLMKRTGREVLREIDQRPKAMMVAAPLVATLTLYGVVSLALQIARLF